MSYKKNSFDKYSSSIVIFKHIFTQIFMFRMLRLLRIFTSLFLVLENKTSAIIKFTNDVIEVFVIEYLWNELYEFTSALRLSDLSRRFSRWE
jgi:hypothetical protein